MEKIIETRTVNIGETKIFYDLERKDVKNLNLRIRKNGSVYVSANYLVQDDVVDNFIERKANYILAAKKKFGELSELSLTPKKYISGESFLVLGKNLRLVVSKGPKDTINSDGLFLYLTVKNTEDFPKKERIVKKYFDNYRKNYFGETISNIYPVFVKYGVQMPRLCIRNMETRWGSCSLVNGTITLNKHLLEAPPHCVEYVVMHEFCHFIYPNHSKQFYAFLTMLMPDWKERKQTLDKTVKYWL